MSEVSSTSQETSSQQLNQILSDVADLNFQSEEASKNGIFYQQE